MISIIVPAYKSEKTIGKCIESLINQTYKDIEIIIVIDGISDNTYEKAKEYETLDSRVRVVKKENEGVSSARNMGIRLAKGEYIQFLDSDDYAEAKLCEKLISAVEKDASQLVICGFYHEFLSKTYKKLPVDAGSYLLNDFSKQYTQLYLSGFLNMPWNKLYEKKLIKDMFPTDISLGEDLEFNLKYMKSINKISVIDEPLIHYIQNNGSENLSTKKREDKLELALRVRKISKEYYSWLGNVNMSPVFDTRFIMEILDEIEALPYDKEMTKKEKLDLIRQYSLKEEIIDAQNNINLKQLDYRIINTFLKLRNIRLVYILCAIRKILVDIMRAL